MAMENTRERLVRYLNDAWAVEKALVDNLREMAEEVDDQTVKTLFEEHSQMTHQQEEALEERIRALGEEPSGGKGLLNTMVSKVGDMMHAAHDEYDKTTQDLVKAYATENLELGMYQSLEAYATAIGDNETAALARQIGQQEKQTADRLWPLIAQMAVRPAHATDQSITESAA